MSSVGGAANDDVHGLRVEIDRLRAENKSLQRLLNSSQGAPEPTAAAERAAAANEQSGQIAAPRVSSGDECTTIIVIGASGDLAKKKTFPAIYALFRAGLVPDRLNVVGYARSNLSEIEFRTRIQSKLSGGTESEKNIFLERCTYCSGLYDNLDAYEELNAFLEKIEFAQSGSVANRLFYFAIPPTLFLDVGKGIKSKVMSQTGWNRLVVEKPFGHDTASAAELGLRLLRFFNEDQLYRIDHYLGKEMVQNLMTLRFANSIFEPIWNKEHISLVSITFKENIGTEGRGGYFDKSGIIRDVMQNHLTQILSLVAMEPPISHNAEDIRDEKVKVLRCISPLSVDRIVLGQYTADKEGKVEGYLDDPGVPNDSVTPTYAMATLFIKNQRWDGVPFILKCGKALGERKAEIRIQFKRPVSSIFSDVASNELVLRVQPKEAIYVKFNAKKPGLTEEMAVTELDLTYHKRFEVGSLPDAYERLILDVIRGDHNLFVRNDELLAAWEIFTPVLHRIAHDRIKPIPYPFGSRGPPQADMMAAQMGLQRSLSYSYPKNSAL